MGILKAFNVPHNKNLDEDTKAKVKEYGAQVKHTFVDSVFGGVFISTVQCEECNIPSQILEPFLDISLPVTEEKVCISLVFSFNFRFIVSYCHCLALLSIIVRPSSVVINNFFSFYSNPAAWITVKFGMQVPDIEDFHHFIIACNPIVDVESFFSKSCACFSWGGRSYFIVIC